VSLLHTDAKPPGNLLGALLATLLGGLCATRPLADGLAAADLPFVACGLLMSFLAALVCWKRASDCLGLSLLGALLPGLLVLGSTLRPLPLSPALIAVLGPALGLLVIAAPVLFDGLGGPATLPTPDAAPRVWVRQALAVTEVSRPLAEAAAQRPDASVIADGLVVETQVAKGSRAVRAATYLGWIAPERLEALLEAHPGQPAQVAVARGAARAGVTELAAVLGRIARAQAASPGGLHLAAAAARLGDAEPLRASLGRFDEDVEVFQALVEAGPGGFELLEELLLDPGCGPDRIDRVCSIARRVGPEAIPFLERLLRVDADPRVGAGAREALRSLRLEGSDGLPGAVPF
jgi:hypothetical protein